MPSVAIRHYTDPACPFAFSAEPRLRRLEWLYGEQLSWETCMVVLSESPDEYLAKGLTPEKLAVGLDKLAREHGMPIDASARERMAGTAAACRAVVAARLHAGPAAERALLRRLRTLNMAGGLLDDPALIREAAVQAGLDPDALDGWLADDAVTAALDADRTAARSPSPAARALDHKLGGPAEERRYTCPSLELQAQDGRAVAAPGFEPLEAYEVAVANLAPDLERREDPASVQEVLAWADFPLATAEIAAVCARDTTSVRADLARSGASFEPAGLDGYWHAAAAA